MPLVTTTEMFKKAYDNGYAIGWQYLSGGGAGRGDGRPGRGRVAGGRCPEPRQAVEVETEGGRGLDKAAIA